MGRNFLRDSRKAHDPLYPGVGVQIYVVQPKDMGGGVLFFNVARDVIGPVP